MVHSFIPREGSKYVSTFEAIQLMIAFATLVLLIIGHNDQKK
ncbi:putative holin-like toxin [Vagococcus lutrae]|nr:putative holin-like toxin [Vagococcus lutrae]MDT2820072.1 putative holin-like toxin [Vagococcus lutrae]MDT2845009.1 putative holin-like toxin [Vagococcus lutrae]